MSTHTASILVVEDDENLGLALADNLLAEGYRVEVSEDGAAARSAMATDSFDLVILDIMLPDTDGYTLCRELREAGVAARILMLTARTLEEDIVRGFDAGADDYVAKPYRLAELLARVRALLRRRAAPQSRILRFPGYVLDLDRRSLTRQDGELVELTRKELNLLAFMLQNRDRALARHEILNEVWGADIVVEPRTVDNFVSNIKRKLGFGPAAKCRISAVRGVGYRFEIDE